ncbi:YbaK/EbsC family protein [Phycicoccus sp. HDW14]|uniref:YbaK/EbsC family protein n=1 Tax=Phycicoccus sp. HDW14 TaxID=2714941 RepID=UPI001F0D0241|nr:YbaK/EbsC family protein [Phycicoccus sp. HDW14]
MSRRSTTRAVRTPGPPRPPGRALRCGHVARARRRRPGGHSAARPHRAPPGRRGARDPRRPPRAPRAAPAARGGPHRPGRGRGAGVTPAEIANSLVFVATAEDGATSPLLVLASGGHRVDTAKVAGLLGVTSLEQADPDFVREHTGMAIGGVAPVGHPVRLRTVVDASLGRYDVVWAAAGHSHAVFATTYDELIRITGGQTMDVA